MFLETQISSKGGWAWSDILSTAREGPGDNMHLCHVNETWKGVGLVYDELNEVVSLNKYSG